MKKYMVCCGYSIEHVEYEVKKAIDDGFVLEGGVSIAPSDDGSFFYAQAVSLRAKEKPDQNESVNLSFQKRVIEEKADLDEKRRKLLAFSTTDAFRRLDQAEKDRLRTQHSVMGVYSEILHQRIAAFRLP
jgi:hypothetical protein